MVGMMLYVEMTFDLTVRNEMWGKNQFGKGHEAGEKKNERC